MAQKLQVAQVHRPRQSIAFACIILVAAGSEQLYRSAVELEPVLGVESERSDAQGIFHFVRYMSLLVRDTRQYAVEMRMFCIPA